MRWQISQKRKSFHSQDGSSADSRLLYRYKPHVNLRFVTEELGFESDQESARFICDHNAGDFLSSKDEGVHLECGGKVALLFEALRKNPPKLSTTT